MPQIAGRNVLEKIKIKNKVRFWQIILLLSMALFFVLLYLTYKSIINYYPDRFSNINFIQTEEKRNICENCVRRQIDGVYVKPGEENLYPIAVIIDNHVDSRPAYGLAEANLVYEAEVEGGITRYLAFFLSGEKLEKIGPVRSSRPYFIDWAKEFSVIFMHVGGSPEALVKAKKENIIDVNEFYKGAYFWRDKTRPGPHNVFTSSERIKSFLDGKKLNEGKYLPWKFKDEALNNIDISTSTPIKFTFRDKDFAVEWKYDIINNNYVRSLGGEIHKDASGKNIKAKNVILQYVSSAVIDEEYRLRIDTIGKGVALICLDGECRTGEWKKNSSSGRTRYYYKTNSDLTVKEVEFNAGTTWVEIITDGIEVNY